MGMAAYPAYDSYKETHLEIAPTIPAHWQVWKVSHAFQKIGSGTTPDTGKAVFYGGGISWLQTGDLTDGSITSTNKTISPLALREFSTLKVYPPGSLVMAMYGATIGKLGKLEISAATNQACCVFAESDVVTSDFAFYSLLAMRPYILADAYGGGQPNISQQVIKAFQVIVPPLPEQRAIAAFLDDKCAKIDGAVKIKEDQIALLRERRQIIIQDAVTSGLNPVAPMKDSAIDWIGQIPAHWEVRRSKFVFTQRKELARKDDIQLSATQSYGVIPQEEYEELVGRRVVKIQTNLEKRKHVELDDFVISMRSFQGGLERAWAAGCIRSSYIILRPLEEICPTFFGYLFKSPRYIKALQTTASFIRDGQDLNFENFAMVDLFLPPISEQREIAKEIKRGCEKIENGIAIKDRQIEALKEYKTSLINAAVTGKIKVV